MRKCFLSVMVLCFALAVSLFAQENKASYHKRYQDPALKELREIREEKAALRDSITEAIQDEHENAKRKAKTERLLLRSDFDNLKKPKGKKKFKTEFHFDPVPQYQSGMCWCFCATSFLESEVYRLTGKKVKLSELHTVYYEYLKKSGGYIKERGYSELGQGSEVNAVFRIMKEYGAVPAEVYTGLLEPDGRHDHSDMFEAIENYLNYLNDIDQWDEEIAINSIRAILNKYIGEPPQSFEYQGNTYTPKSFLTEYLELNLDDYIDVMSTSKIPFYTKGEFDVPDNWWHDSSYYNIPLDEWYDYIQQAITQGYTIAIGGDVSEPGYYGFEDAAFVPDFDIPQDYINQDSREYRIYNGSTEDDHGIHLVGYTKVDGNDWYLIKDSGRGSRHGEIYGYYMYREDYIKLKMLSYTVHKDVLKDILGKFK